MIHLVGLPHTPFSRAAYSCAFTIKAYNLTKMLADEGHHVTVYWNGNRPAHLKLDLGLNVNYVPLLSTAEQEAQWGKFDPKAQPNISWDPNDWRWVMFNSLAIRELHRRVEPGDAIMLMSGGACMKITDQFIERVPILEGAVGYEGIDRRTFCAFESYAWMHNRYGAYGISDGRPYDAVIPGFVDKDDFEIGESEGYALFLGRLIHRKGVAVAGEIAKRAGVPLVVAGTGTVTRMISHRSDGGPFEAIESSWPQEFSVKRSDRAYERFHSLGETEFEATEFFLGPNQAQRKELLSKASVVIVPTLYIEPFGTVHVEALMSGKPVVAPNYGVFTETIPSRLNMGGLYSSIQEGADLVTAALNGDMEDPQDIRDYAEDRWDRSAVAPEFTYWIDRCTKVYNGGGFYA